MRMRQILIPTPDQPRNFLTQWCKICSLFCCSGAFTQWPKLCPKMGIILVLIVDTYYATLDEYNLFTFLLCLILYFFELFERLSGHCVAHFLTAVEPNTLYRKVYLLCSLLSKIATLQHKLQWHQAFAIASKPDILRNLAISFTPLKRGNGLQSTTLKQESKAFIKEFHY